MKVPRITQDGEAVLRQTAQPVPKELFGTKELDQILLDMALALDGEHNGVAIAAPQIGVSYRIFLVRYDRILPDPEEGAPPHAVLVGVYINPEITKTSRRKVSMEEGCLSVAGMFGKTKRYDRATVVAYDRDGNKFERGGGGILAQIFQHETDHLNGILFVDHATDIKDRTSHD